MADKTASRILGAQRCARANMTRRENALNSANECAEQGDYEEAAYWTEQAERAAYLATKWLEEIKRLKAESS